MQNKLKVLHVVPTLKSDGAEIQLSKIFKQFNYAEVELFTFDMYEKGDSIIDNLEETKVTTAKSVFSIFYLHKFIKKNDFKLVHSHLPKSDIVVGIINKFNRRFSHIVSVHAQYGTRKGENKLKYNLTNFLWKYVLNSSEGVIAISEKIKSWLIVDKAIKNENIEVIHYGVEIKKRDKKNIMNNSVGMAARMLPWKGWDKVIQTAHFLKKEGVEFNLKLAGSDDVGYLKNIKSSIIEYDLEDYVEIYDHFSNIDEFFEKIDLFLFLSESEGFGLVVLEAIENNVAVVCSNISPLDEFVENVSDCLVDRDNPKVIASLIKKYFKDNQKELNTIKKLQKEKIVKNFSIDKTVNKIEKFYINAINV